MVRNEMCKKGRRMGFASHVGQESQVNRSLIPVFKPKGESSGV
jgi:hypothetical protein